MAVQKRNAEMVELLRPDFVHKADSLWANGPQTKKRVTTGQTLTIYKDYQYIVADGVTVEGVVEIYGELVII